MLTKSAPHSGAVSKEEVERAAEAMWEHDCNTGVVMVAWGEMSDEGRNDACASVRAAFRAIGLTVEGDNG